MDGRRLRFRLTGINNQNFIMQDEQTGSWWQQVTGQAVLGPLKGRQLRLVDHDQLSFAIWKRETARGRVLKPDEAIARRAKYAPPDWEDRIGKLPVPVAAAAGPPVPPRTLIVGLLIDEAAKAYPLDALQPSRVLIDTLAGIPLALVLGEDGRSIRAFERRIDGRELELVAKPGAGVARFVDVETGSEWDFSGRAIGGPLAGRQLRKRTILLEYWFDWKLYHRETELYRH